MPDIRCPHGTTWDARVLAGGSNHRHLKKGDRVHYPEVMSDTGTVHDSTSSGVTILWDADDHVDPATRRGRLTDTECGCAFVMLIEGT